jgi:hypothetical protein
LGYSNLQTSIFPSLKTSLFTGEKGCEGDGKCGSTSRKQEKTPVSENTRKIWGGTAQGRRRGKPEQGQNPFFASIGVPISVWLRLRAIPAANDGARYRGAARDGGTSPFSHGHFSCRPTYRSSRENGLADL